MRVIIYLIFCSSYRETVCTVPKEMPTPKVCEVVGQHMVALAASALSAKFQCLTVRY